MAEGDRHWDSEMQRYVRHIHGDGELSGLVIGTDVQAWDAQLDDLAGLTPTDSNFIVGDGSNWVAETGATVRSSLGLVAGGVGDIWVEKAGDSMTGGLDITVATSDEVGLLLKTSDDDTTNAIFKVIDSNDNDLIIFSAQSGVAFNEAGQAVNFRIESNNNSGMFFVDGTDDRIGINTTNPLYKLHIVDDSNSNIRAVIDNPSDGVSAQARFSVYNDADKEFALAVFSSNYTVASLQNKGGLLLGSGDGLLVGTGTGSGADIEFYTNGAGNVRMKIAYSDGEVIVYSGLTIGVGAAGVDYTLTFDGETNDGLITWMEDEDYFAFANDVRFSDRYVSSTTSLSAEGPTDDLDVSGVNTVFVDASSNNVTIGGFTGGASGQVIHVVVTGIGVGNSVTLEEDEGTGNQDIFLHGADETLTNSYGGWSLVCDGSNWYSSEQ